MKLLAVGGGSGGHVTPVAAVIKQLYQQDTSISVTFVCDKAFESQSRGIMSKLPVAVTVKTIAAGKFRRYQHLTKLQHLTVPHVVFGNIRDSTRIIHGFFQSLDILIRDRPDVVFAKGGYVCLPMGFAAWLLRIPLVIHDSDTRPGLTNRLLARFAHSIGTGSPLDNYGYDPRKAQYIGVPIDDSFVPLSSKKQQELKAKLGFTTNQFLVVATGGGLGSKVINDAMVDAATQVSREVAIYCVAGKRHYAATVERSRQLNNFTPVEFIYEDMASILGAADVVVSRASATFLQELAGLAKPVIAVPAHQLGDQLKNAEVYQKAGAAVILSDYELQDGQSLAGAIKTLQQDDKKRHELAVRLHEFARPAAAQDLAQMINQAARTQ